MPVSDRRQPGGGRITHLVVADRASELAEHADLLRDLARGARVQLVARLGPYRSEVFAGVVGRYVVRALPPEPAHRRVVSRGRRLASRVVPVPVPAPPLVRALLADGGFQELLRAADVVVAVGPRAGALLPDVVAELAPGTPVLSLPEVVQDAVTKATARLVEQSGAVGGPEGRRAVSGLATALARLPDGTDDPLGREGWEHASRAVRDICAGRPDLAARLVRQLRRWPGHPDARNAALDRVSWATAELTAAGATEEDVVALVAAAVPSLDGAVADHDHEAAAELLTACLTLLFHRELHADVERSPLVDDPEALLAPLRGSALWRVLQAPTPRHPREVDRRPGGDRPVVVVLPGSYGRFSRPVVTALREVADTHVVDTSARRLTVGMGVSGELVAARVRQAMGAGWEPDYVLLEAMEGADAVLVDWADKAALLAVMAVPADVRLVLRIHSMDALSAYVHLIDWSRVDAVIFVSAHVRDVVLRAVGAAVAGVPAHVVPNPVDLAPFDVPKRDSASRTLAVVGWGQRVKDPLWALDVLGRLRAEDPSWRLRLIGDDFAAAGIASAARYADRFRRRLTEPDVLGAVDFVPYTDDVPGALAEVGVILSTSVRESAPVGLTEGAASGAVPVVRDWPLFAPLDGARRQFPEEWVVGTVDEAVARVRSVVDGDGWQAASDAARRQVRERFGYDDVAVRLREVVLPPA